MSFFTTPPEEDKPDETPPEGNPEEEQKSYEEFRDQYADEIPPEEEPPSNKNRPFLTVVGIIGAIVLIAVIAIVGFIFARGRLASRFQQQASQVNAQNTAVAVRSTDDSVKAIQQMTQKAILPATWTPTPNVSNTTALTQAPTTAPAVGADGQTATVAAFLTQSASGAAIGTPVVQPTESVVNSPTSQATKVVVNTPVTQATQAAIGTPVAQAASPTVRATNTTAPTARPTATKAATARATATLNPSATPHQTPTALPETGFAEDIGLPGLFGMAVGLVVLVIAVRRIRFSLNH